MVLFHLTILQKAIVHEPEDFQSIRGAKEKYEEMSYYVEEEFFGFSWLGSITKVRFKNYSCLIILNSVYP